MTRPLSIPDITDKIVHAKELVFILEMAAGYLNREEASSFQRITEQVGDLLSEVVTLLGEED